MIAYREKSETGPILRVVEPDARLGGIDVVEAVGPDAHDPKIHVGNEIAGGPRGGAVSKWKHRLKPRRVGDREQPASKPITAPKQSRPCHEKESCLCSSLSIPTFGCNRCTRIVITV